MKTLWKNTSEDTLNFLFDLGNGKREQVVLLPGADVEIPSKYDSVVKCEAPQLNKVSDLKPIEANVSSEIRLEQPQSKRGRKPKENK